MIMYDHLGCEVLGSSQGVLGLNREAAPEDEGYEGDACTHQQYEVLNALTKRIRQNRSLHKVLLHQKIPFYKIV